jgi:hypothetical protein
MVSFGMLRRVDLVRTDVSEELSASFIGVTRIGELGTTLAVTSNRLGCGSGVRAQSSPRIDPRTSCYILLTERDD